MDDPTWTGRTGRPFSRARASFPRRPWRRPRDRGGLRAVARAHWTVTAGAAAGTAAALALAYGWGRRTGRLAARRGLGPVALFFARRG
ncbi:hypothetical protein O1L60_33900 [Streptomyces diastatochromogenes]|nr:hypothetical protein [Streptomyces diastatochromogenes]